MADHQEVLKVFGAWGSPFSSRVEIALKMKGVEYELIKEDVTNKSPLFLKYSSLHKKNPVLLLNGNPIAESILIIEYIDETWKSGPTILPEGPHQRATFGPKKLMINAYLRYGRLVGAQGRNKSRRAIKETDELLRTLEDELKGKKFFGGESIGLADIAANFIALLFGILQEIRGIKLLTKEKFPKITECIDEYLNCNIFKESLPPRDKLLALFQSILQRPFTK